MKVKPIKGNSRGFTLAELMTVIAIIGILSALAALSFRGQREQAKSAEARAVLGAISSAQELWRSEFMVYLDTSDSMTSYFPPGTPSSTKQIRWRGWETTAEQKKWFQLNVVPKGIEYVQFGYASKAGLAQPTSAAADVFPELAGSAEIAFAPDQPWFVVQAASEPNSAGKFTCMTTTSVSNTIYLEEGAEE